MCTSLLLTANRRLLDAIETPPDDGTEERLDRIAASLWRKAHGEPPDPGTCCRFRQKLRTLDRRAAERRSTEIARARRAIESYGERRKGV